MPRTGILSLTLSGTRSRLDRAVPALQRAALANAAARASAASSVTIALRRGLTADIRSRIAFSASIGENACARYPAASSVAASRQSGVPIARPSGAHDRSDWRGAGRALMLGAAGHENRRIERNRGDNRAYCGARMPFVINIGVRQHGIAPPAYRAGRARLGLGEYADHAPCLVFVRIAAKVEAGAAQGFAHTLGVDGIAQYAMADAELAARRRRIAE